MDLHGLVMLIIWLAVLGLIYYVINWALSQIPLPAPFPVIIRVIMVIVILVVALDLIVSLLGSPFSGRRLL